MSNSGQSGRFDFNPQISRRNQLRKISKLSNYRKDYNLDTFMNDLLVYFDNQVDFNVDKIRQEISKPQKLNTLIEKAGRKNTHPVVEFLLDLFEDLGQSGNTEWSGEW